MYWRTQRSTKIPLKMYEYTRSTLIYYKGDSTENSSKVLILQHCKSAKLTDCKLVILKVLCRHANSFCVYVFLYVWVWTERKLLVGSMG